ncbi:hypothetical protein ACLIJR_18090 [Hydrogenophaga sp. XSHU_21]
MSNTLETDSPDWPTTLRFSRRLGEAVRGADYAVAIEGPRPRFSVGNALWNGLARMLTKVGKAIRPH